MKASLRSVLLPEACKWSVGWSWPALGWLALKLCPGIMALRWIAGGPLIVVVKRGWWSLCVAPLLQPGFAFKAYIHRDLISTLP
jgi:hypothetical protein